MKRLAPEPSYEAYVKQWAELYEGQNYDVGLTGYFLKKSHEWSERPFSPEVHFGRVLEVGAGTGVHVRFVRHSFDEYVLTDLNPPLLKKFEGAPLRGKLTVQSEDATRLSFADDSFDRVIAAHVLEHLYRPHEVLREWARVLKPGGLLTIVLPCDPGLAWRLGRYAVSRPKFNKAGILYDYWMAREHVNPLNNLVPFIRHYFSEVDERWLPMRIPSMDLNLFYIVNIRI